MAQRDLPTQITDALTSLADAVGRGIRAGWRALRRTVLTDANLQWARELAWDAVRSVIGVVRVVPSVRGAVTLFGDEIVGTAVGWTAGLTGAALVSTLFEKKGIQNLWGLAGRRDRMLVSRETYEWMSSITSFVVGLLVLIVVRHFVRSWLAEFNRVREAREQSHARAEQAAAAAIAAEPSEPTAGPAPD